jgi:hypothetical protein
MSCYDPWGHDPGPCPIDDEPHHVCVSADYAGRSDRTIVVSLAMPELTVLAPDPLAGVRPGAETAETFSTSEYRGRRSRTGAASVALPRAAAPEKPRPLLPTGAAQEKPR